MVDLGEEAHARRGHGVVLGEEELQAELAALVRAVPWALDLHVKVAQILLVRAGDDAGRGVCHQPLRLLDDPLGERSHGVGGGGCLGACSTQRMGERAHDQ